MKHYFGDKESAYSGKAFGVTVTYSTPEMSRMNGSRVKSIPRNGSKFFFTTCSDLPATVALLIALFGLSACDKHGLSPVAPEPAATSSALALDPQALQPTIDSLARGFAIALAQAPVRVRFHADLRDSPFRHHRLHLASYLRGESGRIVAAGVATAMGTSLEGLYDLQDRLPDLEIVMPNASDRLRWDGTISPNVVATAQTLGAQLATRQLAERGFNRSGIPIQVPVFSSKPEFNLAIQPVEKPFPPNPEGVRSSARHRLHRTVTTAQEERGILWVRGMELEPRNRLSSVPSFQLASAVTSFATFQFASAPPGCDPEADEYCCPDWADECPPPPPEGSGFALGGGGALLPSSFTYNHCMGLSTPLDATNDRTNNRVLDSCEYEIAQALRPVTMTSVYETAGEREPYWSISRHPTRQYNLQIFYALSFWEDAGIPSAGGYGWHHGDSEFLILEVRANSESTWGVVAATLSAHWHAGSFDATATYAGHDLEYYGGNLRVWSSIGKHANYRSRDVCEWGPGGPAWSDTCAGENIGLYVVVRPDANLGNFFHVPEPRSDATRIIDPTSSASSQRLAVERFWTGAEFAGWNMDRSPSSTRYSEMLEFYGF